MRRINFKDLILDSLLVEAPALSGTIDWSAAELFSKPSGKPNPPINSQIPYQFKADYDKAFAVSYPNSSEMNNLINVMNGVVLSRGGAKTFEKYADYFPLLDLMFIIMESNRLGAGDFKATNKLSQDSFDTGSAYDTWVKQLKTSLSKGNPMTWEPKSTKGHEVKAQLNKDQIDKYAALLALKTYYDHSILFAITQLLEVRKEMRWNFFSKTTQVPFTKTRERVLPTPILNIFQNPKNYAGGITQFPADIKNRYDNTGGLELKIHKLALTCDLFFEAERTLYFGTDVKNCQTSIIEVLNNTMLEAGASSGLFNYTKVSDQSIVPATGIGKGGYTIRNLEEYIKTKQNPQAEKLWELLQDLADYTKTNTFSASQILGGAKQITNAIGGFAGSFGK